MTRTTNARVAGSHSGSTSQPALPVCSWPATHPRQPCSRWSPPSRPWAVWLPLLVFDLTFAVWLISKGVATPAARQLA